MAPPYPVPLFAPITARLNNWWDSDALTTLRPRFEVLGKSIQIYNGDIPIGHIHWKSSQWPSIFHYVELAITAPLKYEQREILLYHIERVITASVDRTEIQLTK
jgi:hypothetical protein